MLALVASASLLGSSLYAADVTVKSDKNSQRSELSSGYQGTAKNLIGATVADSQGQKIGTIEDLVLSGDQAQFAVVKLNSDLAQGKAYTPIPLTAIRAEISDASGQPKMCLLSVDRNKIETASRFNVERWPADQTWGPEVCSHYGMGSETLTASSATGATTTTTTTTTTTATGATGSDANVSSGTSYKATTESDRGIEYKTNIEPLVNYQEKSVDNGTAPDGKTTFPYLHHQTRRH